MQTAMRTHLQVRTAWPLIALRVVSGGCVVELLVAAIVGGLLRAGLAIPVPSASVWPSQAVVAHAFLMICGFMGTVIGIERAVAIKARLAFLAPTASALAGAAMLAGHTSVASWVAVGAAVAFVAVNVVVVERQPAPHTALLLAGALAWLVGNVLQAVGSQPAAAVPWWFAFLVMTIAAERLEMTRLMRRRRGAGLLLCVCLGAMLLGLALFAVTPMWGGIFYGLSLVGLATWLVAYDIVRRIVAANGLSRYMAICLLLGYIWLAISGLAWLATSIGLLGRDIALHALGLGFAFSMVLGHAPVILPALVRIKLYFGWFFYVPLAVLHVSLAVRLCIGTTAFSSLAVGAAGNALAIALFALTMVGSAVAWRLRHSSTNTRSLHARH